MRIAVASENKIISSHFGRCEVFEMYDVEKGKVINHESKASPGHRPGFLPVFLSDLGVNVIIAGGMGETAQQLFKENNIDVVFGVQGSCDQAVDKYLKGGLQSKGSICTEHQYEGHCNE